MDQVQHGQSVRLRQNEEDQELRSMCVCLSLGLWGVESMAVCVYVCVHPWDSEGLSLWLCVSLGQWGVESMAVCVCVCVFVNQ